MNFGISSPHLPGLGLDGTSREAAKVRAFSPDNQRLRRRDNHRHACTRGYRVDLALQPGARVTRAEVARALVDQLADRTFLSAAPFVLPARS